MNEVFAIEIGDEVNKFGVCFSINELKRGFSYL